VTLTIGEPLPVDGLTDADARALSEKVRDAVEEGLGKS
jgi:hypothetical protein